MARLFCLLILGSVLRTAAALACEPCPQCLRSASVWKEEVPLNTLIRVSYVSATPFDGLRDNVRVQDTRGRPVPGVWEPAESNWLEFHPAQPLQPGRRYALADRYGNRDGQMASCRPGNAFKVWRTFKTTAPATPTPPPTNAWPTHAACTRRSCPDSACCGPYDGWEVDFTTGLPSSFGRMVATAQAPAFGPHRLETSGGFTLFPAARCGGPHPLEHPPAEFTVGLEAFDDVGTRIQAPVDLQVQWSKERCQVQLVARPAGP